jgi:hypothetical protein
MATWYPPPRPPPCQQEAAGPSLRKRAKLDACDDTAAQQRLHAELQLLRELTGGQAQEMAALRKLVEQQQQLQSLLLEMAALRKLVEDRQQGQQQGPEPEPEAGAGPEAEPEAGPEAEPEAGPEAEAEAEAGAGPSASPPLSGHEPEEGALLERALSALGCTTLPYHSAPADGDCAIWAVLMGKKVQQLPLQGRLELQRQLRAMGKSQVANAIRLQFAGGEDEARVRRWMHDQRGRVMGTVQDHKTGGYLRSLFQVERDDDHPDRAYTALATVGTWLWSVHFRAMAIHEKINIIMVTYDTKRQCWGYLLFPQHNEGVHVEPLDGQAANPPQVTHTNIHTGFFPADGMPDMVAETVVVVYDALGKHFYPAARTKPCAEATWKVVRGAPPPGSRRWGSGPGGSARPKVADEDYEQLSD